MKIKKILSGLISAAILSMTTVAVFANPSQELTVKLIAEQNVEAVPINAEVDKEDKMVFGSFRGTVVEIKDFTPIEGAKIISLEDEDKMPINMIVSKDTYVVNNAEIQVGSTVTGYYQANSPMILIYPPQYNPVVVVVESDDYQVKVDAFNEDLVSSDNMLKLNISEDTKIVTQDGQPFEGQLGNQKLVVLYTISTKSIPAQTTPIQVTVLSQKQDEEVEVEGPVEKDEAEDTNKVPVGDVSKMPIMVEGKKINSLSAYTNDKGVVMVPLRPVADELGLKIVWEGQSKSIRVGIGATLTIDKDHYTFARMAPIKLGTAPEVVDGTTFLPLDFFTQVLQMNQAEISEGQIIIK